MNKMENAILLFIYGFLVSAIGAILIPYVPVTNSLRGVIAALIPGGMVLWMISLAFAIDAIRRR